jgi:glycosyltransferase involved in cell wall biosynthesis
MAKKADGKTGSLNVALFFDEDVYDRLAHVLSRLCVGLVDQAVKVTLVTSCEEAGSLALGPVRVIIHEPMTRFSRKRRIQRLVQDLSGRPPDVVHAISAECFRLCVDVAAELSTRLVLHATSFSDVDEMNRLGPAEVDHVVAASQPILNMVEEFIPRSWTRSLIRPGIRAVKVPTCFVVEGRTPTIVSTADFDAAADVRTLIEAVRLLRRRGHDLMLFLCGEGDSEHSLRRIVKDARLERVVTFARPTGDVGQILQAADISVAPSVETAVSSHALQAMGFGLAVVATGGGVADWYVPGENSIKCESMTPDALSECIERLLTHQKTAQKLAAGAIDYVKKNHAISTAAERMVEMYQKVTERDQTIPLR